MGDLFSNYCHECEWCASTATHTRSELARAAVEHAVATGHDIDSLPRSEDGEAPSEARKEVASYSNR